MKTGCFVGACAFAVLCSMGVTSPAELGDVNGDGRVSYADAVWYARWVASSDPVFEPAAGSDAFGEAFPCTGAGAGLTFIDLQLSKFISLEGIRRVSTSPLPHFLDRWPGPGVPQSPPPAPDGQVLIELLPVVHRGGGAEVELQARVTNFVPLLGLELVLKARGLELRPPREYDRQGPSTFTASGEATLLSDGELLVYGLTRRGDSVLEIGEHEFSLQAILVKGTSPGKYVPELVAGTEGVSAVTGAVVVPAWTSGEIEVVDEVSEGTSHPFPPLVFDEKERRILGTTEMRVTGAEGSPGDEVVVRVQLRTERPVNKLAFWLLFDAWALQCTNLVPVLTDPDDGAVHLEDYTYFQYFNAIPSRGEHWGLAQLSYTSVPRGYFLYEDPRSAGSRPASLKYIEPLGEWVDIAELSFTLREGATGRGSTPIVLPSTPSPFAPVFAPYADSTDSAIGQLWGYGDGRPHPCATQPVWWSVETEMHSGNVRVLGGGEPREPAPPLPIEEAGFSFALGETAGRPGQIVKLPVSVEGDVDFWWVWVVLGYDPARLDLVGYEIDYFDPDGAHFVSLLTPDAPAYSNPVDCARNDDGVITGCRYGYPWRASLRGPWAGDSGPPGVLIANVVKDVYSTDTDPELMDEPRFWLPGQSHEVGRAVFRIRGDAAPGVAEVGDVNVEWQYREYAVPTRLSSGAKPLIVVDPALSDTFERYDVPALSVKAGRVRILGDLPFLRGDANQDGKLDLGDAVHTLGTLFLGAGALLCPDAADANDDGGISITDPVYALDHLFRGGPALPAPYPDPGTDPTGDDLQCEG